MPSRRFVGRVAAPISGSWSASSSSTGTSLVICSVRGAVDEDAVLQLAIPLDPARDDDPLGHAVMVLGEHAPQLRQPECLDLLQPLRAALLLGIGHVRPDGRRVGQHLLVLGHLPQPLGREPGLGHGLAGLERLDRHARVVGRGRR